MEIWLKNHRAILEHTMKNVIQKPIKYQLKMHILLQS